MFSYPFKIILFPGGCGGNFLAEWLSLNDTILRPPNFQIDIDAYDNKFPTITLPGDWSADLRFPLGIVSDLSLMNDFELIKIKSDILKMKEYEGDVCISHITDIKRLKELINVDVKYIISWPLTNKFGWIKNTIYKNPLYDRIGHTFDSHFRHISYYVNAFENIVQPPSEYIFDFGDICNIDVLKILYLKINGKEANKTKIAWAKEYIGKQFQKLDDVKIDNYQKLRRIINPKDIFDVALLVYLFEKNNPYLRRIWAIDDLPSDFQGAIDFIDTNYNRYYHQ
jgi:hypothetical protein